MAWGAPPAAKKLPGSLSNDQQFPSLGAEPSRSGPIGGSSSVSHHAGAVPSKKIEKKMAFAETIPAGQGATNLGYHVTGSKKGGFPVTIEKRSCGKRVTVVRNVVGDSSALLSGLKKKLGCGGVISKDGIIEIQGERQSAVEKYLTEMNCLKSVSNAKKVAAAPAKKERKVAEPTKIDKKMAELGGGCKKDESYRDQSASEGGGVVDPRKQKGVACETVGTDQTIKCDEFGWMLNVSVQYSTAQHSLSLKRKAVIHVANTSGRRCQQP
eukprot:scaffold5955_cov89-Skeletonema_dohrnii-CCMP3373.AAC.1